MAPVFLISLQGKRYRNDRKAKVERGCYRLELLKFTLSGKNAFFKKPEVNSIYYFTYSCIHRIALFGIFGSILGYGGYGQLRAVDQKPGDKESKVSIYPEFYERLKAMKIAIVPLYEHGMISKKIQYFNNSVGYASKEQGGNLIVKEQWLDNPAWDVYFSIEDDESRALADALENNRCVYIPYLGKNDHIADIKDIERLTAELVTTDVNRINSLFLKSSVVFDREADNTEGDEILFKSEEMLPVQLTRETNMYEYEKFVFSNGKIGNCDVDVWAVEGRNIVLF